MKRFVYGFILSLVSIVAGGFMMTAASASQLDQVTATPRQFCRVQYLVFVNRGVSVNVRPTPSRNTTPMFTINGTANPYSSINLQDGWFQLCSINGQYVINDPSLVSFVTVTPSATQRDATPTRLVTNTPSPIPTMTPTPDFVWIVIDTDRDEFGETVIRCEKPCDVQILHSEP